MTQTCVIGEADPFLARLLLRYAEVCGLRAIHAQTGQDVLEIVRRERPDVVVLDSDLPGKLRGRAVIEAIGNDPELSTIPLIHCSWHREADVDLSTGRVVAHLHKPELRYDDFVAALARAGVSAVTSTGAIKRIVGEEALEITENSE